MSSSEEARQRCNPLLIGSTFRRPSLRSPRPGTVGSRNPLLIGSTFRSGGIGLFPVSTGNVAIPYWSGQPFGVRYPTGVIVLDYGRSQSPIRRVNLSEFNTFVHEQRTRWGPQSPIGRVNQLAISDCRFPIDNPSLLNNTRESAGRFDNRQSAIGNPLIPYWSGPPIGDFGLTIFDWL